MKQDTADEEFLISRARKKDSRHFSNSKDDSERCKESRASSKAWLITSRLILPKNFNLQYEAYSMEKENGQPEDAAKTFKKLYDEFSSQEKNESTAKLWQEIDAIVEILALKKDSSFLKKLFDHLPAESQRQILIDSSHNSTEALERLKRLLLAFKTFPDLITKHGSELKLMIDLCKQRVHQRSHLDEVVTLFITEMAPLMIPIKSLAIEMQTLHEILLLAFEFVFISLLRSKEVLPWNNLLQLFSEVGQRLNWTISRNIKTSETELYHQLLALHQSQQKKSEITQDQIFYCGSLMFFKSLHEYARLAQGSEESNGAILVEAFVTHEEQEMEPLSKRRRTTEDEKKIPEVTHADFNDQSPLVEAFLSAVRYYDLLASDQLVLNRLQGQLRPPDHVIYPFFVDIAIYQGRFKEALTTLRHIQGSNSNNPISQCRFHLKAASMCYATGDNQSMTDQVWQALAVLSTFNDSESTIPNSKNQKEAKIGKYLTQPSHKYRHIHFLDFNKQSVIAYAVKILYLGLKEKAVHPIAKNDLAIGHILSLLQYIYPDEEDVISLILDRIKRADNFTYPMFMHHITHIDFLEMFSNVMMESNVTLDIAPTYTGAPAASSTPGRRLGTRGANRGEKNEIKTALKKQVSRSFDNLDDIILDFINKNRDSLFQCML